MKIKDQEAIMKAIQAYLLAKDAYLKSTSPETIAVYTTADEQLRATYKTAYIASLA